MNSPRRLFYMEDLMNDVIDPFLDRIEDPYKMISNPNNPEDNCICILVQDASPFDGAVIQYTKFQLADKENNDESPEEIHGEIVRGREEDETEEEQSGSLWMADLGWIRGTGEEKTILQSETPELFNDSVLIK